MTMLFHKSETCDVFEEFKYMGWNEHSQFVLLAQFLDTLNDEGHDVLTRLRSYLQEQADVEEGYGVGIK